MKKLFWIFFGLLLAACSTASAGTESANTTSDNASVSEREAQAQEVAVDLPNLGPAPELENEIWLNTSEPLRLANLRGKVVLLDMWTFGCINCRNVIPSLRGWHNEYKDRGLVVIGNHYPEFSYEEDLGLLKQALVELDVPYAVAQDNDRLTWGAYNNRYWPTLYLIDKNGNLRYTHIGEGRYAETEAAIVALLNEPYP
ncbi:MAG TPA: redoxin domain-containing protein [Anaerolineales bacterium]|nr:redoxin domain-containing protein [Anaerolineales bacterium]